MWPRDGEVAIGLWLMMAPFFLGHAETGSYVYPHDLIVGAVIATIALSCYVERLKKAHLLLLPIAGWLALHGWWNRSTEHAGHPEMQNHIIVGLLLLMFAVLPTHASEPPPAPEPDRARG